MSFVEVLLVLIIFIPLLLLWVFALVDLFRRDDVQGGAKALWAIIIVLLPIVGMFIYFIVRPSPVPATADGDDLVDRLERLEALHERGSLTDEEFSQQKAQLLGQD